MISGSNSFEIELIVMDYRLVDHDRPALVVLSYFFQHKRQQTVRIHLHHQSEDWLHLKEKNFKWNHLQFIHATTKKT